MCLDQLGDAGGQGTGDYFDDDGLEEDDEVRAQGEEDGCDLEIDEEADYEGQSDSD